jgi:hypothetical protein
MDTEIDSCTDDEWQYVNSPDNLELGFGFNGHQAAIVQKNLGLEHDSFYEFLGHHHSPEGIENRITCLMFALTIPKDMIP